MLKEEDSLLDAEEESLLDAEEELDTEAYFLTDEACEHGDHRFGRCRGIFGALRVGLGALPPCGLPFLLGGLPCALNLGGVGALRLWRLAQGGTRHRQIRLVQQLGHGWGVRLMYILHEQLERATGCEHLTEFVEGEHDE